MQLVDKNNGKPLFEPWLPTYPQNGVPQEKYDEFLEWKEKAASEGVPECMLTYGEYEATCARKEIPVIDFRYMPW